MKYPRRKILSREHTYSNLFKGGWRVWLTLECGHVETRKGSQEPAFTAGCRQCYFDMPIEDR